MPIKNVVFDIGNVLFRWDPHGVVVRTFSNMTDPQELVNSIFKHQTWLDLNLGHITEQEAVIAYQTRLLSHAAELPLLMDNVRESLLPLDESIALLKRLQGQYELYALTDNTLDIMTYLKKHHDFWTAFKGIVVSAEVGHLKPSEAIYRYLLDTYGLVADETVFIDDLLINVEGARKVGIKAVQFKSIEQCRVDLKQLGLILV